MISRGYFESLFQDFLGKHLQVNLGTHTVSFVCLMIHSYLDERH